MPVGSLFSATSGIARSYRSAQRDLSKALARLGSLQRFQTASQDSDGYIKLRDMQAMRSRYDEVLGGVQQGQAFIDVADAWVSQMLDQLGDLRGAITSGDVDSANGYINSINASTDTAYGGSYLNVMTNTFETVMMADGTELAMQISSASPAISGLVNVTSSAEALTLLDEVDVSLTNLNHYADTLAKFGAQVDSHAEFLSTMVSSIQSAESSLTAIDEAYESTRYTEQDIRQQAAIAMLAQGALSRRAILDLFDL